MSNNNIPYNSGHPWFYVLGGKVPSIKEIWSEIDQTHGKGILWESITKADGNNPKLKRLRNDIISALKADISQYRKCAIELHKYRKKLTSDKTSCEGVHVSICLKKNHIYYQLLHLDYINRLLEKQPELFDL